MASYRQLPVNDLPNVDFPTIQVNASLSGQSDTKPDRDTPLENRLSTIAGVDSMTSSSGIGQTGSRSVQPGRDSDAAAQDVRSRHLAGGPLLQEQPPPWFRKVSWPTSQCCIWP